MFIFDTVAFLSANFGEPGRVAAFLRAYKVPTIPDDEAVRKWFSRGRVPGDWMLLLLAYLELERGQPVSLTPYLGGRKDERV